MKLKNLIFMLIPLLISCVQTYGKGNCPEDYIKVISSYTDSGGAVMNFYDIDCDSKCDGAGLYLPNGILYAQMDCETARQIVDEVIKEEEQSKNKKKGI